METNRREASRRARSREHKRTIEQIAALLEETGVKRMNVGSINQCTHGEIDIIEGFMLRSWAEIIRAL